MNTKEIIENWNRGGVPVEERLREALEEVERLQAQRDDYKTRLECYEHSGLAGTPT